MIIRALKYVVRFFKGFSQEMLTSINLFVSSKDIAVFHDWKSSKVFSHALKIVQTFSGIFEITRASSKRFQCLFGQFFSTF